MFPLDEVEWWWQYRTLRSGFSVYMHGQALFNYVGQVNM